MPNGNGALECCYCAHYQSRDGKSGYGPGCEEGRCTYWDVELPTLRDHRICAEFVPTEAYERDNRATMQHHGETIEESVQRRKSWFGIELERGVLYDFGYNNPPGITALLKLAKDESL